jgi:hypothetical protein
MLPRNLKYTTKSEAAFSKSFRNNVASSVATYVNGDKITIKIPTLPNQCLNASDSFFKFTMTYNSYTTANSVRFDSCGAHGIIKKIKISHGSNLLEEIDNYGLICKMLFDLQQSQDRMGMQSILAGCKADSGVLDPTMINKISNVNSGDRFTLGGTNAATSVATIISGTETYCLNLVSLLGSLSSQYVPLFAMQGTDLTLEIQLVQHCVHAVAGISTQGTDNFSLKDVEFVSSIIELSDQAMGLVKSSIGERLEYVIPTFKSNSTTFSIAANTQQAFSFNTAFKYSSVKAVFVCHRENGEGTNAKFPYSCITAGMNKYNFKVGTTFYPTKEPTTQPEYFAELIKCVASMSDLQYTPAIDKSSYNLITSPSYVVESATATSAIQSGSFYVGVDLESFGGADKSQIFNGFNSNTCDIIFTGGYYSTAALNLRLDTYAMIDQVFVVDKIGSDRGIASVQC